MPQTKKQKRWKVLEQRERELELHQAVVDNKDAREWQQRDARVMVRIKQAEIVNLRRNLGIE